MSPSLDYCHLYRFVLLFECVVTEVSGQIVPRSTRKGSTRTRPSKLVHKRQASMYPGMQVNSHPAIHMTLILA